MSIAPMRTECFIYPVHSLTITRSITLYTGLKLLNTSPTYFHAESNLTFFKKEIYKVILECESYCIIEIIWQDK